jgi:hypothetical protein
VEGGAGDCVSECVWCVVCVCVGVRSPPYFFTPSILGSDEPPLLEEPPAFFVAHLHRPTGRHSTQGKSAPALRTTPHPPSIVCRTNPRGICSESSLTQPTPRGMHAAS